MSKKNVLHACNGSKTTIYRSTPVAAEDPNSPLKVSEVSIGFSYTGYALHTAEPGMPLFVLKHGGVRNQYRHCLMYDPFVDVDAIYNHLLSLGIKTEHDCPDGTFSYSLGDDEPPRKSPRLLCEDDEKKAKEDVCTDIDSIGYRICQRQWNRDCKQVEECLVQYTKTLTKLVERQKGRDTIDLWFKLPTTPGGIFMLEEWMVRNGFYVSADKKVLKIRAIPRPSSLGDKFEKYIRDPETGYDTLRADVIILDCQEAFRTISTKGYTIVVDKDDIQRERVLELVNNWLKKQGMCIHCILVDSRELTIGVDQNLKTAFFQEQMNKLE